MEYIQFESLSRLLGAGSLESWMEGCTFPGQAVELTGVLKRYTVSCMGNKTYDAPFEVLIKGRLFRFSLIGASIQARTKFGSSLNLGLAAEFDKRVHQFDAEFKKGSVHGTIRHLSDSLPQEVSFNHLPMARRLSRRSDA